ncbi:MAG: ABC transporter ATP-binding protein [Chloroflexota bacterium]|nr:ABC transporter ATP-binding protein [Chloroflexota bacterium]MDE2841461.1 ABC transporter ATP-binding protein [Chloroflexota bacterium]MDE2929502.1 ABC transporter ATP-binding protein [Chloroflexota bacterium]
MTGVTVNQPLLEAHNLTKHYGQTIALHDVDMHVREGITGLLGPNGAGKSTAMKLFLGLLQPTAGSATVLGEKPYENITIRMRLGYMPEHDCLPDFMTASEFLSHMAQVSGIPAKHARTRAADMLRHVGLDEERYRHIKEYSTGMKQRVKLAQALVHDPVLVLLDEPTAGLDPGGREEMLQLVRRTGQEFGINIMLSSHLMGDVESTCDRIIVIEGGAIIEQGDVSEFTQETETFYIDVDDRRAEVIAALEARGIKARISGGAVVVRLHRDEQLDDIRDALVAAEARLRRLAPSRGELSDIFRRSTG